MTRLAFRTVPSKHSPRVVSMTVEVETWPELMTAFVHFLNAAGFHIDADNIDDWHDAAPSELPKRRRRR